MRILIQKFDDGVLAEIDVEALHLDLDLARCETLLLIHAIFKDPETIQHCSNDIFRVELLQQINQTRTLTKQLIETADFYPLTRAS